MIRGEFDVSADNLRLCGERSRLERSEIGTQIRWGCSHPGTTRHSGAPENPLDTEFPQRLSPRDRLFAKQPASKIAKGSDR